MESTVYRRAETRSTADYGMTVTRFLVRRDVRETDRHPPAVLLLHDRGAEIAARDHAQVVVGCSLQAAPGSLGSTEDTCTTAISAVSHRTFSTTWRFMLVRNGPLWIVAILAPHARLARLPLAKHVDVVDVIGIGGHHHVGIVTTLPVVVDPATGQAAFNSSTFGLITSSKPARFIQVVARFDF